MQRGNIVLITFPYTDLSGKKLRPALVVATTVEDLTVPFITTQIKWKEDTDIILSPDDNNGIKKQSLLRTSKIATLNKSLVQGRLGTVSTQLMNDVNSQLKIYLKL